MPDHSGSPDRSGRQAVIIDVLLGFAVFAVVAIAIGADIGGGDPHPAVAYGFAAALGLLMLVRRRWPMSVLLATSLLLITYYVVDLPVIGLAVPMAAALYSAASFGRTSWTVGAAVALVIVSTSSRALEGQDLAFLLGYELASTAAIMGAAIALGDGAKQRREGARQRERIAELDRQAREAESAERLARERARIARDLHDAVGHHLSVVSLHTAVAGEALEQGAVDLPAARTELEHVAQAAREGLRDLRSTVRALRGPGSGGGAGGGLEQVAGLAHLAELVASVRAAGLAVEVRGNAVGEGSQVLSGLPGLVDATAYRVVQEALTNTIRHARARGAVVLIERAEDALEVTVTDDGTAAPTDEHGKGTGLAGMRERVRMVEGTLETGAAPGGGFRVRARIPLGGDA
ncbi:sensor histidine kinase [Nocardiopsis exhalans]|uniref:histidine kinase n=1 Tax=Nocardiopsis exhalans TaxID=163604 RepID=A0ABY5DA94_9ACTN|nr:sensor histidine kinase [Nocardiopsis exhalans]USY20259.1 sensor histidine kinase [Nocardiopsis exhalans]